MPAVATASEVGTPPRPCNAGLKMLEYRSLELLGNAGLEVVGYDPVPCPSELEAAGPAGGFLGFFCSVATAITVSTASKRILLAFKKLSSISSRAYFVKEDFFARHLTDLTTQ